MKLNPLESNIEEFVGKKFKYVSKYSGLSDWTGEIVEIRRSHINMKGIGEPIKFVQTEKGIIPFHREYDKEEVYCVYTKDGIRYELDEIELIDE